MPANSPRAIILHDSASPWGDARVIDDWHQERGFRASSPQDSGLQHIGYHFVVLNGRRNPGAYLAAEDGLVEQGRNELEVGAHCIGFNFSSIGVCLIGTALAPRYTAPQMQAALELVQRLVAKYRIPAEQVLGHRETGSGRREGKIDPGFDLDAFRASLRGANP